MTVSASLYATLAGTPAVAAIVGTRIYPVQLPQNPTYEAITYHRVSNTPQVGSTTLKETRYQINCWADRYADGQTLAMAVKGALETRTNIAGTPVIKMSRVVNEIDDYDPEVNIYRVIIDVLFNTTGD